MPHTIILNEEQYTKLYKKLVKENIEDNNFDVSALYQLPKISDKNKYCAERLPRVGAGSSRIVYKINDNIVIKLAKNQKGIAQNEVELNFAEESNLFPQLYDYDKKDTTWIISEYARRATSQDFMRLTGHNFKFVKEFIELVSSQYSRYRRWAPTPEQDKFYERVMNFDEPNSEFFYEINEYLTNYQINTIGDLMRPSSWGVAQRQNGDELVIVDYGLTDDVFDKHYKN